jgi:uncharacterized protein YdiU (UPF0061 family)
MKKIKTLNDLASLSNYSFMDTLNSDPEATTNGIDHQARQVFLGHYVPVKPTPIQDPIYIAHSKTLFHELGFDDSLATSDDFVSMFCGDLSDVPEPMRKIGWATGYALSIYGREYYEQCPFQTGNGYGDGRAISVFEGVLNSKRWEMQLKGAGQTPYCRGADGRAVLRSSVREFLAQEHMYALGIPTSRSLSLYTSKTQTVQRPWFSKGSHSYDPDRMISEPVAISTRVAPSFIRVGQVELFARRARKGEHPKAMQELEQIVLHLINREYSESIDQDLGLEDKVILLAQQFRTRLSDLIVNWIRVGYCQGNFNSDNCAVGGFTLDYGPFGFCDLFDPSYQPWTGGGKHFSFLNQAIAARKNFYMFYKALDILLQGYPEHLKELEDILNGFDNFLELKMQKMWASKLGLDAFDEQLFHELKILMIQTGVDYTIFFRELSSLPDKFEILSKSFYTDIANDPELQKRWLQWFEKWQSLISNSIKNREEISNEMKLINPKYTLREWFLVPAYERANEGDYTLIKELQEVMSKPYEEQSKEIEEKYYRLKPTHYFNLAGVSHLSCSS